MTDRPGVWILALLMVMSVACGPSTVLPDPQTTVPGPGTPGAPATSLRDPPTPAGNAWRRIPDIPTPRSEVATAEHQGNVYVVGGFGGRDRVERYVDVESRWERVADLPHGVDHAMAAAVSGLQSDDPQGVFVFGGYAGTATARSFRFDPPTDRWEEIAPMPGPRAAGAAVAAGSDIYVVGGADGSRLIAPTYVYSLRTRSWRIAAPIPTPRDHLAAVNLHTSVCAVGGRRLSMSANLGTLECLNTRDGTWQKWRDAPTPRGGVGAAQYDGRIYLIGGEQPSGTFKEVEIYDPATDAWSRGPDLATPRHGLGVAVVNGTIFALTGGPTPGGSQTAVCEALRAY